MNLRVLFLSLSLSLLTANSSLYAAEYSFTAQGKDHQGHFLLTLMHRKKNFETMSKLVRIHPKTGRWISIALPTDARDREVLAIVRGAKQILVLTQLTVEQGDDPILYGYEPKAKKWRNLGVVSCPVIRGARAEKDRFIFQCEKEDEEGKTIHRQELLALKEDFVKDPGELKIYAEDPTVKVRLRIGGKDRVFSAKALFLQ